MAHRAQRQHFVLLGQQHVAGAGKVRPHLRLHGGHDFLVPDFREAAARAIFCHAEIGQRGVVQHQVHLGLQALAAFFPVGILARVAEVDLVDDGQHRDLEQDRVQPRAFDLDRDLAGRVAFADVDAALGHVEQPNKINEVGLDETQAAQGRKSAPTVRHL
ncbi:hypothetical protein G6F50_016027 [Rhizopus delemar]|uniref:Uncharacterized protein n=1 Tax=Rhizopus delemar TaxID=936053 RepID=A0A9P7C2Z0_9FUNG|nr:hypothetical protein G6F50_016027 [Rhizopus delemar]